MSPKKSQQLREIERRGEWLRAALRELALVAVIAAVVAFGWAQVSQGAELIVFTGPNCPPCESVYPVLRQLSESGVAVERIDLGNTPEAGPAWQVTHIPTFVAVDAARQERARIVGVASREQILAMLSAAEQQGATASQGTMPFAGGCRISAVDASDPRAQFWGSGVLVENDGNVGRVLTCWHTFRGSRPPYTVCFPNGQRMEANLQKVDEASDLAHLVIQSPAIQPAEMVLGAPSGNLVAGGFGRDGRWRVVQGAVTGTADRWYKMQGNGESGDSGGPVYDSAGRLVGIRWGSVGGEIYFTGGTQLAQFVGQESILIASGGSYLLPWRQQTADRLQRLEQHGYGSAGGVPMPGPPGPPGPPGEPGQPGRPGAPGQTPNFDAIVAAVIAQLKAEGALSDQQQPSTDQLADAVLARLEPMYIRVQDARGSAYSTEYQEVRLGKKKQYVTLPFGPRSP